MDLEDGASSQSLLGFNGVINPMGWDSFGLPAENAALDRGINPKDWTIKNIAEMKDQLNTMGFEFDWDAELSTSSPEYFKHTQAIFKKMRQMDLAYKEKAWVNWDPVDQTVLANEQIDSEGRSWRSGARVERKKMEQWYLNITKYAPELLEGLNDLPGWPAAVKESQRGWIGEQQCYKVPAKLVLNSDHGASHPIEILLPEHSLKHIHHAKFLAISNDYVSQDDLNAIIDFSRTNSSDYEAYLK